MSLRIFPVRLGRGRSLSSFTLIELLVVISIIGILAALTLAAASAVLAKGARSRAQAEIQAMSAGLESYKNDNGIYPVANNTSGSTNSIITGPPYELNPVDPDQHYQMASGALYAALSGTNAYTSTADASIKSYMSFKTSQLGDYTLGSGYTYIKDPFSYPYGYSTGAGATAPYNGAGFFDLWSTGGVTANNGSQMATNSWISNWQQ